MLGMCTYFFEKTYLEGLMPTHGFPFTVLGGNGEKCEKYSFRLQKGVKNR